MNKGQRAMHAARACAQLSISSFAACAGAFTGARAVFACARAVFACARAVFACEGVVFVCARAVFTSLFVLLALGAHAAIQPASGDVNEAEHEWVDRSPHPLDFTRYYRSSQNIDAGLGTAWSHNWAASVTTANGHAAVRFGDGSTVLFTRTAAAWVPQNGRDQLLETPTGFLYEQASTQTQWQFDAARRLQSITQRNGWRATLAYTASGRLERVTNAFGRALAFVYDSANHLVQVTFPDGTSTAYAYDTVAGISIDPAAWLVGSGSGTSPGAACAALRDGSGFTFVSAERGSYAGAGWYCNGYGNGYSGVFTNLKVAPQCAAGTTYTDGSGKCESTPGCSSGRLLAATYADGSSRSYAYEDARFCQAVTGVAQNTSRIASYAYDTSGRATTMQHAAGGGYAVTYPAGSAGNSGRIIFGHDVDPSLYRATIQVTDANGNAIAKTWQGGDGQLRLVGASSPLAAGVAARTLDERNLPVVETDFNGVQTATQWDAARQLPLATTEAANTPLARTTQTTWHPTLRLPVLVTEPGRSTASTYDAFGNVLTQTVTDTTTHEARTTRWTYGANNLPATMTDARGRAWEYGYDAAGNRTSVKDPLGQLARYGFDNGGRVVQQTDAAGVVTRFAYDARGRVASETRDTETTTFTYTAAGQVASATLANGYAVAYRYDAANRLLGASDNRGSTVTYTLDGVGNRIREEVKDARGTIALTTARVINALNQVATIRGAAGQGTQLAYDANGEPVAQTDPLNNTTRQTLDALRRTAATTFPDATAATQAWTALDQLAAVTDPKGVRTQYTTNAFGEVLTETSPDIGTITYSRDTGGDVIATTDAKGQFTRIERDALGRPATIQYADGSSATFSHDAAGFAREITDASGITTFTRDAQGRVLTKTTAVNDNPANPSRFRTAYGYTAGDLTRIVYPSGLAATYIREAGRITRIDVQPAGGATLAFVSDLTYTALGQPKTWRWSSGDSASRGFDADARMTSNEFASYIYDAAGRMTGITQQLWASRTVQTGTTTTTTATTTAGTTTTTTELFQTPITWTAGYDSRSRLTSFTRAGAETRYTYDGNSNRLSALDSISGTSDLDAALDGDRTQTTAQTLNVENTSNRLLGFTQTVTSFKAGKPTGTVTTPVTYTVDANGAMTSDGLRTYEYDAGNRLAKVKILRNGEAAHVRYLHNALGQRVFKSEPESEQVLPNEKELGQDFITWLRKNFGWLFAKGNSAKTSLGQAFIYGDGEIPAWALLGEYDNGSAGGKGTAEYIWLPLEDGGAIPIGMYRSGSFYAIHTDHLGTPRLVTDTANKPVWQWPYSGFGANEPTGVLSSTTSTTGSVAIRGTKAAVDVSLRFPGQIKDQETGLNDNFFRTYDPKVRGGYIQPDPIGLAGGRGRFNYGDANSLKRIDPLGLATQTEFSAATIVLTKFYPQQFARPPTSAATSASVNGMASTDWSGNILLNSKKFGSSAECVNAGYEGQFLQTLAHEMLHVNQPRWQFLLDALIRQSVPVLGQQHAAVDDHANDLVSAQLLDAYLKELAKQKGCSCQ